jgi:hypothetical protein
VYSYAINYLNKCIYLPVAHKDGPLCPVGRYGDHRTVGRIIVFHIYPFQFVVESFEKSPRGGDADNGSKRGNR